MIIEISTPLSCPEGTVTDFGFFFRFFGNPGFRYLLWDDLNGMGMMSTGGLELFDLMFKLRDPPPCPRGTKVAC